MTEAEAKVIYEHAKEKEERIKLEVSALESLVRLESRIITNLLDHPALEQLKARLAEFDAAYAKHTDSMEDTTKAFHQWTKILLTRTAAEIANV